MSFEDAHRDGFKQLVNQTHEEFGFPYDGDLDGDLDDPSATYEAILVALAGGEVVGSVALREIVDGAEVKRMYLAPDYRGRGQGRRLLMAILEIARKRGHRRVQLDTAAHQTQARHLYEAAGFQPTSEGPGPEGSQSVSYELTLT